MKIVQISSFESIGSRNGIGRSEATMNGSTIAHTYKVSRSVLKLRHVCTQIFIVALLVINTVTWQYTLQ